MAADTPEVGPPISTAATNMWLSFIAPPRRSGLRRVIESKRLTTVRKWLGYDSRMHKWTGTAVIALGATCALVAQDRLKTMPAHQQYEKVAAHIPTAIKSGALAAAWTDDSRAIEFTRDGKRYHYDVASRRTTDTTAGAETQTGGRGRGAGGAQPERG